LPNQTHFGFEEYLDFIKDKKIRISLTQFRVSSHDLNIEVGRYTNITRNQRICMCVCVCIYVCIITSL